MNVFDGILKGIVTSVLGLVIMGLAVYGWIWGDWFISDNQAMVFGGIGFALLFIREKLADLIIDFIKSKIGDKTTPPAP